MKIDKIDVNLAVGSDLGNIEADFRSAASAEFALYGLLAPDDEEPYYKRMPKKIASAVSSGVVNLSRCTAGGRIRFSTDSSFVAISAKMTDMDIARMPHMPLTGSAGFDLYASHPGDRYDMYIGTFKPPYDMSDHYESVVYFPERGDWNVTINFPLYAGVQALYIGLEKGSKLGKGKEYANSKPVLYYGSSITQGGCASRPGTCYQAFVSQLLECDYINLGFSGNARAEKAMADYLAEIDAAVFVCDYDHNAPNVEHLEKTHYPLYERYRQSNPATPVIFLNRSKPYLTGEEIRRRDVIKATYDRAVSNGDKNVYFIDMSTIYEPVFCEGITVDGAHPNDLGYMYMARALAPLIGKLLKK